jgi:molybdate transport system substrate-binding protein
MVDMFIGYASYAPRLRKIAGLTVFDIPAEFSVQAQYTLAVINKEAESLAAFLGSPVAQRILSEWGFGPGSGG